MILNPKKIFVIITLICLTNYSELLAQSIQWNDDESGFYKIKDNELILHSTKGDEEIIIISKKDLSPANSTPLKLKGYQFSIDKNKALIFTNTKRVWRRETKGDYWILDLNNKKLMKLGKGLPKSSLMFAKFSPDGNNVAYVSKENTNENKVRNSTTNANIFIENLSNNQIKKLTSSNGTKKLINGTFDWAYEEEFNCRDGFLFNNSGTKIAFWQIDANQVKDFYMMNNTDSIYSFNVPVEYPKVGQNPSPAKIGIINLINNNSITWIKIPGAPDNNYLPRMTWSPNSDELFIQQLNHKQNHSKLFIANTSTGSTKLLMEEKDNAWVDVRSSWPNQVQAGWKFINKGKEFLYTTEKDGWIHVYRFNINTKKEYLVTKGEYDVHQSLAVDEKSKLLYFIASPNNATQRYLYKVRLDGKGKLDMVTPNELEGSHNYQISPKANFALHRFSNYYTKPMNQLIQLPSHNSIDKGKSISEKFDPSLKDNHPLNFFQITTVDNVTMDGWIVKPKNMDPNKKYPILFYFYSEPAGTTAVDRYGVGNARLYNGDLREDGYVYVSFDGRGTPSLKGRAWRKAIYRSIGKVNVRDMGMGALEVFKKFDFIDTTRVAVHGWSGGGSATLNCLFQYPNIFHTGIAIAAVANQLTYDNIYQERYMGIPSETKQDFIDGSPITHAKNFKGNLLYMHGTADDNVHYQNAEMLINELIKHKKVFYFMAYPNRSHGIRENNAYAHVAMMFTDFLKKNCLPGGK